MHISLRETRQANLLGALGLTIADRLGAGVAEAGRSFSAAAALVHIRLRPAQTIDFLARLLAISHPAAVRLVDRLEADGLVERHAADDRRARALFLSAAGEAAATAVLAERAATLADILAPLSATERRQLEALLEKLLAAAVGDRWNARHVCRLCDFPTCDALSCPVDAAAKDDGVAVASVAPVAPR